jgi:surface polysaccharide O-acyltransferase-like enzyme
MKENATREISYINYLRILAICLVIFLHCVSPFITNAVLYGTRSYWFCLITNEIARTGVPLFFMISGYLLLGSEKTLSIGDFYKRRLSRILIPLLFWNIAYYLYYGIYGDGSLDIKVFLSELLYNGTAYHLWYVYTLFGIYLMAPFLKRIVAACTENQVWLFMLIIMFTGTLRPIVNMVVPIYVHLFDPLMEGYIAYFVLGYILGTYLQERKHRYYLYFLGLFGGILGIVGNHLSSFYNHINLVFNGGYTINHFLLASALFVLIREINWLNLPRVKKFGSNASKLTFGVYFIHVMVMEMFTTLALDLTPIYTMIAQFFFTTFLSFLLALVLSRFSLKRFMM